VFTDFEETGYKGKGSIKVEAAVIKFAEEICH